MTRETNWRSSACAEWELQSNDTFEIQRHFGTEECFHGIRKKPTTSPYLEPDESIPHPHPLPFQVQFNVIHSLCLSVKFPLHFRFDDKYFVYISHLCLACYMPRPSHLSVCDNTNNIWWSVKVMTLLIMQSSPPSRHSPLSGPKTLLSTLLSDTLNLCSSLNVIDSSFLCLIALERCVLGKLHKSQRSCPCDILLCALTKHHAMKAYWGIGCIAPLILWPRH